jgi:hypothetical protein
MKYRLLQVVEFTERNTDVTTRHWRFQYGGSMFPIHKMTGFIFGRQE